MNRHKQLKSNKKYTKNNSKVEFEIIGFLTIIFFNNSTVKIQMFIQLNTSVL